MKARQEGVLVVLVRGLRERAKKWSLSLVVTHKGAVDFLLV